MYRTPEKSSSETNLHQISGNAESTPITTFIRHKRKRSDEILTGLSDFKSEIKEMISSWMAQQNNEKAQITTSLKNIENSLSFLSAKYDEMNKKVELMEQERLKDRQYIVALENKYENLLKTQRKCCFELKNVPRSDKETKTTLIDMVNKLSSHLKIDLNPNDIKDIYRVTTKGETRPIIIEMSSHMQKLNIMGAVKKYNNFNRTNKLNTQHLGVKGTSSPIFLSDHLTPNGNRLYYLAREMSRAMNYRYCWTSLGDVLVRKDENSPIIKIISESQVKGMYETNK